MESDGHGGSTFDQQVISYDLMMSDVLALMDILDIKKASLLSHPHYVGVQTKLQRRQK